MNGLIWSRFFCSVEKSRKKKDEFLEKIPGQEMKNILFCVCVVRLGNFLRFLKSPTIRVCNYIRKITEKSKSSFFTTDI